MFLVPIISRIYLSKTLISLYHASFSWVFLRNHCALGSYALQPAHLKLKLPSYDNKQFCETVVSLIRKLSAIRGRSVRARFLLLEIAQSIWFSHLYCYWVVLYEKPDDNCRHKTIRHTAHRVHHFLKVFVILTSASISCRSRSLIVI